MANSAAGIRRGGSPELTSASEVIVQDAHVLGLPGQTLDIGVSGWVSWSQGVPFDVTQLVTHPCCP